MHPICGLRKLLKSIETTRSYMNQKEPSCGNLQGGSFLCKTYKYVKSIDIFYDNGILYVNKRFQIKYGFAFLVTFLYSMILF